MAAKHILVIDRDGDVREVVAELLLDLGYRVSVANHSGATHAVLVADAIDLIVLDPSTSHTPSIDIAREAKERGIRLVMISGDPATMELFQDRADQLLWKPFGREALEQAVHVAFASGVHGQRHEDPR